MLGFLTDDPAGESGQEFSYSNTDYILLGMLVEALDGTDLDSSLGSRIRTPLGLQSTHFPVAGVVDVDGLAQP